MNAAGALWHFTQVWLQEFPEYKPKDGRISLWAESYGPRYGLAFAAVAEERNKKIRDGVGKGIFIKLDTMGIVSGWVDAAIQSRRYPEFAFNNTYGIQVIGKEVHDEALKSWRRASPCYTILQANSIQVRSSFPW